MLEHTLEQIQNTEKYFRDNNYPYQKSTIGGRKINYFILPQSLNDDLPDFVYRVTNNENYVMGVSDSLPQSLQPFFILEEYIEFMEKGIETKGRVVESEKEVISLVPSELKSEYIQRRIQLFEKELELDIKQPDKYALGEDGRIEFKNNLTFLNQELKKIKKTGGK